jgi:hypothetical protein
MTHQDDDAVRAATLRLMSDYQRLISQPGDTGWIDLWAEDGVLEFPYAPAGRKSVYTGKAEIAAYMAHVSGRVKIDGLDSLQVFPMQDPRMAVVEMALRVHSPVTGDAYTQRYVAFFETKDGRLQRYREYWNPLVTIDAVGGREVWTQGFGFPEGEGAG